MHRLRQDPIVGNVNHPGSGKLHYSTSGATAPCGSIISLAAIAFGTSRTARSLDCRRFIDPYRIEQQVDEPAAASAASAATTDWLGTTGLCSAAPTISTIRLNLACIPKRNVGSVKKQHAAASSTTATATACFGSLCIAPTRSPAAAPRTALQQLHTLYDMWCWVFQSS
jgi:hypothetical protein